MARQQDVKVFLCELCHKPIDSRKLAADENVYRKATGWTRRRAQGGANAIRLAVYHEEFAHKTCVELTASGVMNQGGMF